MKITPRPPLAGLGTRGGDMDADSDGGPSDGNANPKQRRRLPPWAVWATAVALVMALGVALGVVALSVGGEPPANPGGSAFIWLRPQSQPRGWKLAVTRTGATLAYPPGWSEIQTDPGTASAAPAGARGAFDGYLNATPRSGEETLANWSRFRVTHVAAEGARHVHLAAASTGLRFRSARGSCVIDSYSTTKTRFREIACIVAGARAITVVVAAAPVAEWAQKVGVLERAVASFTT
jgi:hypothetical protein